MKSRIRFLKNIGLVLIGRKTWVGYKQTQTQQQLPVIKPGVVSLADNISDKSEEIIKKMNIIYAKDYSISSDIKTIANNLKSLGN